MRHKKRDFLAENETVSAKTAQLNACLIAGGGNLNGAELPYLLYRVCTKSMKLC